MVSSRFGRGFIINLCYLYSKFSNPPERAWYGAQDYLTELVIPDRFKGTEVEELVQLLRQKVMWHQAGGPMDVEMYADVKKILGRLLLATDKNLGIAEPDLGQYHE